jgi:7-cyano-7-deazaguanine synthase
MSEVVVLLSGGQDSTTALFWAKMVFDEVRAISFRYGQRHEAEIAAAKDIAAIAGVAEHYVFDATPMRDIWHGSALVDLEKPIQASGGFVDSQMPSGLPTSFVVGRNLYFLAVAAMFAASRGTRDIATGVCQTDFSGYPDCREAFVRATERAVTEALPTELGPSRIHTPLMNLTKAETVTLAKRLGPDCWRALAASVTCYEGHRPGCGKCPACELRRAGFRAAGVDDPAGSALWLAPPRRRPPTHSRYRKCRSQR